MLIADSIPLSFLLQPFPMRQDCRAFLLESYYTATTITIAAIHDMTQPSNMEEACPPRVIAALVGDAVGADVDDASGLADGVVEGPALGRRDGVSLDGSVGLAEPVGVPLGMPDGSPVGMSNSSIASSSVD
mmetsp:Transcript_13783/g.37887  ORF Transcript_13783/g.37887 Transcript_13783/m.37887 type:complete len:131 (+) Transcript_13783:1242-1634(+)